MERTLLRTRHSPSRYRSSKKPYPPGIIFPVGMAFHVCIFRVLRVKLSQKQAQTYALQSFPLLSKYLPDILLHTNINTNLAFFLLFVILQDFFMQGEHLPVKECCDIGTLL